MKMTIEHFEELKRAIETVARKPAGQEILASGHSAEQIRWDLLHASGTDLLALYDNYNDDHIDTALRKCMLGL